MKTIAALVLAMAGISAPAAAQYGSSSPPPRQETPRPAAQGATPAAASPADVLRAAACQVARDAASANALLATVPRSTQEREAAGAFLRLAQRCVRAPGAIGTGAFALRGAIAESLYEAQFATDVAAHTPALAAAPLLRPASTDPLAAGLESAYALVDCAAPRQPALIRALLASDPGTEAEGAALRALNPAFSACVTASTNLQVDMRGLRSLLAEALYHWSVVQRDGPASPWAVQAPASAPASQ